MIGFGYIPTGVLRLDIVRRIVGEPNLLKRLQAKDIMAALALARHETVVDLGCGSGYLTVEMAKVALQAVGVDTNSYMSQVKVPVSLRRRLQFQQASGDRLPFGDETFDCVLASEVLPMIPDAGRFLCEAYRVLRPGGRLVVVNGLGHPVIERAYHQNESRLWNLRKRYPRRFPESYEEYCRAFQTAAGTARKDFMSEREIRNALTDHGFHLRNRCYSPSRRAGEWLSWRQFELYLRSGTIVRTGHFILPFIWWSLISRWDRESYRGGLIMVAEVRKQRAISV